MISPRLQVCEQTAYLQILKPVQNIIDYVKSKEQRIE